jgi:hypothetical protein
MEDLRAVDVVRQVAIAVGDRREAGRIDEPDVRVDRPRPAVDRTQRRDRRGLVGEPVGPDRKLRRTLGRLVLGDLDVDVDPDDRRFVRQRVEEASLEGDLGLRKRLEQAGLEGRRDGLRETAVAPARGERVRVGGRRCERLRRHENEGPAVDLEAPVHVGLDREPRVEVCRDVLVEVELDPRVQRDLD